MEKGGNKKTCAIVDKAISPHFAHAHKKSHAYPENDACKRVSV